jgi:hypothetical protein
MIKRESTMSTPDDYRAMAEECVGVRKKPNPTVSATAIWN